jgi:NADP-dependent 3-hydroxy acid dehydrogenase YdfG
MSDQATKIALVTGTTSGIGKAIVLALRAAGHTVYAVGRNESTLNELVQSCGAIPVKSDVRDTNAISHALAGVDVDVLVNNAGILSTRAAFQEIDPAEIDAMIDVNLKAPMHLARAFLPAMVSRRRGHLIFIGSIGGHAPFPNSSAYGASKAGLSLFCDDLRCDLLGTSVRVSEIVPGRVETDLYRSAIAGNQAQSQLYDGYRSIQPEHIAHAVLYAIRQPDFIDISRIEIMPTDQAVGGGTIVKYSGH